MLIVFIIVAFLLAGVFAVLWFLSGTPHSEYNGGYPPPSLQFSSIESSPLSLTNVNVPDVFNESRIKSDLAVLSRQPTLLAQYIAQAEIRFSHARQIAVLERWTQFYNVGKEVIIARTDLIRAHNDFLQVNREGEIRAREKDVKLAHLDADLEEADLRKARILHAKVNLGKELPQPKEPEPPLTAEEQRLLRKAKTEAEINRLRAEKVTAVDAAQTEAEKVRIGNIYDDRIARLIEELARYI